MLWNGSVDTIPSGWTLCDGTMGTPDLRNRFVVAAGDTYSPNSSGGALVHRHTLPAGAQLAAGSDYSKFTDYVTNIPSYYALCYIQKL